jgi:hypothetical protein
VSNPPIFSYLSELHAHLSSAAQMDQTSPPFPNLATMVAASNQQYLIAMVNQNMLGNPWNSMVRTFVNVSLLQ